MGCAAIIAVGFAASGCTGLTDSYSAGPNGGFYNTPDYYAGPPGGAQGYYGQPYYAAPYPYSPGYVAPYSYQVPRRGWQEHQWRERRENAFRNDGHQPFGQPHQDSASHMPSQPMNVAPAAPPRPMSPPPAAPPQAAQNRALIDQLGFRPSH